MRLTRAVFGLVIGLCSAVSAATFLDVQVGWNGAYRGGRWGPLFVTTSDPTPRNALIELHSPHDQICSMSVRQVVAIGPTPATFAVFAPLGNLDELAVILRDASTGRHLADWSGGDRSGNKVPYRTGAMAFEQVIVIAGRSLTHRLIQGAFHDPRIGVRSIEQLRLPAVAQGYDSLSLLMLDQPDLARLSAEQQQAIAEWVRGGGQLVCWMSEDALPASSPILDAMPAVVGENVAVELSESAVRTAGLPARFRKLKARMLSPLLGSEQIALFSGEAYAWRRQLGFGAVVVLPLDPSSFIFDNPKASHAFWRPLVDGAVELADPDAENRLSLYNNPWNDPSQQIRTQAANAAMDMLGDVPGAGRFGFSYVAMVMIGLMCVVGPIDWFVLKRLGRQPWTWVTTSGWIALVTLGAVYIGHAFKSGDLHFRTLRLIDQADGSIAASVDALSIYSPRTRSYELSVEPEGWWEPLAINSCYYARGGMKSDIRFHQDYRGNRPEQLSINVWNLRFLTAQTIAAAPPIIEASLHYETRQQKNFMVGKITNRGGSALSQPVIRVANGICRIGATIAPGATLNVNQPFTDNDSAYRTDVSERWREYGYASYPRSAVDRGKAEMLWGLSFDRSRRIDQALRQNPDMACIYAAADAPPAAAQLKAGQAIERHWQFVRALIRLQRSGS